MSAIELSLVEAFAGASVTLDHLNTRLLTGAELTQALVGMAAVASSTMVKVAMRLGIERRAKIVPSLDEFLAMRARARGEKPKEEIVEWRVKVSMRETLSEAEFFGTILAGSSWYSWRVLLIAAAGEELLADERAEFARLTGREREPGHMVRELIAIFGRRAGKSLALAVFDCWIAVFCDHRDVLAPGETGIVLCISRDQRIARVIVDYIEGILHASPILAGLIANRTADTIELRNGISIEVRPANYKTLRGLTCVAVTWRRDRALVHRHRLRQS